MDLEMMKEKLYLEDFFVGLKFTTDSYTLGRDQIKQFATEYDPQPFHLDDAAAEKSFFQGLAASGWQVMSITMRLLVTSDLSVADGIIGARAEISWPKATRPGDTLKAYGEIIEIRPSSSKPDRGMVTVRVDTCNQMGEAIQVATIKFLAFRRSIAA